MSVSLTPIVIVPEKQEEKEHTIRISSQLFRKLQLLNEHKLVLLIGKKLIEANLTITDELQQEILLSRNIFEALLLPIRRYNLQGLYQPETNILQLGPIIGLLTDFRVNEEQEPNFRSVHQFCQELHHGIEKSGGFFYVFSYYDFPNKGYFLINDKWEPAELPLPDVIYNRVHSRRQEYTPRFKQFRKKITQLAIPLFNDRFLSKWEVHEQLIKVNHLHPFIPETRLFSRECLFELLQKYETIYIKPVHGSQGRNIFKIIKLDLNQYTYQASLPAKPNAVPFSCSLEELYHHIKKLLGNRIYIIQQGIPLITHDECVMDFRALCHNSGINEWRVTSLVARISEKQEIVSNLAKGGRVIRPLQALGSCMDQKEAIKTVLLIKDLAIATAAAISSYSTGIIGELGIDIGIDQGGRLWLIEVNSKPSKSFEDGQAKIRPSAKAIIEFCRLLTFDSGFEREEPK